MPWNKELALAYQILDGIPAEKIDLDHIVKHRGRSLKDSVACGLGWLLMHPRYTAKGFGVTGTLRDVRLKTPTQKTDHFDVVAAEMFGIPVVDAAWLFNHALWYEQRDHKELLLERIEAYLYA